MLYLDSWQFLIFSDVFRCFFVFQPFCCVFCCTKDLRKWSNLTHILILMSGDYPPIIKSTWSFIRQCGKEIIELLQNHPQVTWAVRKTLLICCMRWILRPSYIGINDKPLQIMIRIPMKPIRIAECYKGFGTLLTPTWKIWRTCFLSLLNTRNISQMFHTLTSQRNEGFLPWKSWHPGKTH